MPGKLVTTEDFVRRSIKKFGDQFDYSKTIYTSSSKKLIISCKKHGECSITPNGHLSGTGCKQCSRDLNGLAHKLDTKEFISRSKLIHGDKYDYSMSIYEHSLQKLKILCPQHGEFFIKPSNHINNKQGCSKCGTDSTKNKIKRPTTSILDELRSKPNSENFCFDRVVCNKSKHDIVEVKCNKHGWYKRKIVDITRSNYFGCKNCRIQGDTFTNEIFISNSNKNHSGVYSYEKVDYKTAHIPVIVTCNKHGDFTVIPHIHIKGGGFCPKCTPYVSSYEIELLDFLKKEAPELEFDSSCRNLKVVREIDILCKSKNIAIEINGLYWHSDLFKDKNYHLEKTNKVAGLGYRLFHIFEDEWVHKKDICKSILLNSLGKTKTKTHARKCEIREVSYKDSKNFLLNNHIQGNCSSKHRYGLFYNNSLVSLMTFSKNRLCTKSKHIDGEYEMARYCSLLFSNVIGGASKLFSHFVKNHKPKRITSYCDKRFGSGVLYEKLGFLKGKDSNPGYFYTKGTKKYNRFSFRKFNLVLKGYDKNKTEYEIMKDLGYNRVWDCGCMKFTWEDMF